MLVPDGHDESDLVLLAGVLLSGAWHRHARLGGNTMPQMRRHHSVVMRCPVAAGPGCPDSVVLKAHRARLAPAADEEQWSRRYNPDAALFTSPGDRYRQELAGLRFMRRAQMPVAAPEVYAHDDDGLLIVMEDLGGCETVLEPLLRDDRTEAERGVLALTRAMARLHAASVGREQEFTAAGGIERTASFDWTMFQGALRRCVDFARSCGLTIPDGLEVEVAELRSYFTGGGPLVFSPGDVGPGNQFLVDGDVVLFDFEFARYRHFALELANLLVPFPVVWTSALLPDELTAELREAYFAEAGAPLHSVSPDQRRQAHLYGVAWWTFASVGADLAAALVDDYQWGLSSCRERHLHKLALLARMTDAGPELQSMGKFAEALRGVLADRWPGTGPLPAYPSFRGAAR